LGIAKVAVERKSRGLPDLPDRSSHPNALFSPHAPPPVALPVWKHPPLVPSEGRDGLVEFLASGFYKTEIDFLSRRSDNYPVGGRAAPTCAVATRDHVLTTAKALEPGAASGRPNPT
jgi:hypothetical protein